MKASQMLRVEFERYTVEVRFSDLDPALLPLAYKLEEQGDRFGGVNHFDGVMCITMGYADKRRDGVDPAKIFGYPAAEFLAKQYK